MEADATGAMIVLCMCSARWDMWEKGQNEREGYTSTSIVRCTTGSIAGVARLRSLRLLQALCRQFEVGLVCTSDEPIYSNQRVALEELTGAQTLIHRVYGPANRLR